MATIQVAETLELRQTLARQILFDTLWRQALLVLVITRGGGVGGAARDAAGARDQRTAACSAARTTWRRLPPTRAPRELLPLIDATNQVMARLAHLLAYQKRFVRDTSHQLRTPLAVLRTQLQSAQRGDVDAGAGAAGDERHRRARHAAGQPDAGAGQGRAAAPAGRGAGGRLGRDRPCRGAGPGAADRASSSSTSTSTPSRAPVRAHEWALRELTRNLLHNAIKLSPAAGPAGRAAERHTAPQATLRIADSGPGITRRAAAAAVPALRQRRPAQRLRPGPGHLPGDRRHARRRDPAGQPQRAGRITGLDAVVSLPLADNPAHDRTDAAAAARRPRLECAGRAGRHAPGQVAVGGALLQDPRRWRSRPSTRAGCRSTARPSSARASCAPATGWRCARANAARSPARCRCWA